MIFGRFSLIFAMALFGWCSYAAEMDSWTFRSKYDNFKIERRGDNSFIDKSQVSMDPLKDFLPFFNATIEGDCPGNLGQPDVVITAERGREKIERKFYLAAKQVAEDKKCGDMNGAGIYYLPLHRSWFNGPTEARIKVGSTLKVEKEGHVFAEFERNSGEWRNKDTAFFSDWDFFNQFVAALEEHSISGRIHQLGSDKSSYFKVTTSGKTYTFYKIGGNLWGIKRPERDWLVVSPTFVFLQDMSTDLWRDRHSIALAVIKDSTQPPENRIKAVQELGSAWTQAIKLVFHAVLTNVEEDPRLKQEITYSIKQKPSLENFGILVQALEKTQDIELLQLMTSVLKIRHRRGPSIEAKDSQEKVAKAIAEWKIWWQKMGPK